MCNNARAGEETHTQVDFEKNNFSTASPKSVEAKASVSPSEEKKEKSSAQKEKNIPPLSEVLSFAKDNVANVDLEKVKVRYNSWVAAGWRRQDGNVFEWKSRIIAATQYLQLSAPTQKTVSPPPPPSPENEELAKQLRQKLSEDQNIIADCSNPRYKHYIPLPKSIAEQTNEAFIYRAQKLLEPQKAEQK